MQPISWWRGKWNRAGCESMLKWIAFFYANRIEISRILSKIPHKCSVWLAYQKPAARQAFVQSQSRANISTLKWWQGNVVVIWPESMFYYHLFMKWIWMCCFYKIKNENCLAMPLVVVFNLHKACRQFLLPDCFNVICCEIISFASSVKALAWMFSKRAIKKTQ